MIYGRPPDVVAFFQHDHAGYRHLTDMPATRANICAESKYGRQDRSRLILALGQETAFGNRRPAYPALDAISFVATE
jgi:hypothetical protein